MPSIRVPAGFVRGESRAAVPGRYSDGNLIRWQNGVLKPIGGWERQTAQPLASRPRWAFVWLDERFERYQGVICDNNVYVEHDSIYRNITPADWRDADKAQNARGFGSGNYGKADYGRDNEDRGGSMGNPGADNNRERTAYPVSFSADKWGQGEFLFGTSADGRIFVWNPSTPNVAPIVCPNAPTLVQSFIVTDERHLMAFGGAGKPNRVAWSDSENREGWDFLNVEGQAGWFDLQDAGLIYCARKIPGAILIFTQTSVWVCRYIGYPNFYGFTKLADSVAPVSPQSVVVAGTRTFWWGTQSFFKYEGGVVAPIACDLGTSPFEDVSRYWAPKRVTGGYNGNYQEVWWFYPSAGQNADPIENDRYVIFNFLEGWWADGSLARSFFLSSPIDNYPVGGAPDGMIYSHERGWLNAGQPRAQFGMIWAQVETLSFEDGDRLYSVTQMQPDTKGAATDVRFEFECRESRGGPNLPVEAFTCREDGYCDARFTARDFTMRVIPTVDGLFGVGALNFDAKPRGKR